MNKFFTDEDYLRLLQLMTRKSISDRQRRDSDLESDETDDDADKNAHIEPETPRIPSHWRLIPERTTLYEWQKECLPIWLSKKCGTVKVATGGGKTLFALAAAQQLQNDIEHDLRLVIVVPTIPLMFQWFDEIQEGNIPDSAIGLMGAGRELSESPDLRILICVLNSARRLLPGFVKKADWSKRMLLIVDECHRTNAKQAQRIFETKPKFTLGLSATPEQELDNEIAAIDDAYAKSPVGKALGPIVYTFSIKQSLSAGLLTPFEVWHIGLSLSSDEAAEHARLSDEIAELRRTLQIQHRKTSSSQGFLAWCQTQAKRSGPLSDQATRFIGLANQRKRLLYRAKSRINIVLEILSESLNDPDGRTIVFHESIDEIEKLFFQAEQLGLPVVLEHSKLPDSLRADNIGAFRRGISRIIISAKSLVEGFNVPSADLGIIMASSGSVRQRIQSLGRMLRRKTVKRDARIIVLYIRDTEDEAIYEKADWENIIGAERNRYFSLDVSKASEPWVNQLTETSNPPRLFLPSSWDIDVNNLSINDQYPAQPTGIDVRVDQSNNLRTEDGALVSAPLKFINAVCESNPYKRARITPAGHLIIRVDPQGSNKADWRFLGSIDRPENTDTSTINILRIRTSSGKRVIALEDRSKKGNVLFALGPDNSRTKEGGQARDLLLEWTKEVEKEKNISIKEIYWDNSTSYWLEIRGERIPYNNPIAPLEFKT